MTRQPPPGMNETIAAEVEGRTPAPVSNVVGDDLVEKAARALASAHYAGRFNKPEDDEHVVMNVDANWYTFAADVRVVMSALGPSSAAPHVLDKAARVGAVVFRAGVSIQTVIEAAQRLYDHGAPPVSHLRAIADAAQAYVDAVNGEPEKDCWDTEDGKEAPGALRFASDWAWQEYDVRKQKAFDALRASLAAEGPQQ